MGSFAAVWASFLLEYEYLSPAYVNFRILFPFFRNERKTIQMEVACRTPPVLTRMTLVMSPSCRSAFWAMINAGSSLEIQFDAYGNDSR